MNRFSNPNFLLTTSTAKSLFQSISELPVIDCHCPISAEQIAQNQQFDNITQLLLEHDQPKLQAMRIFGIDEYYITGEAGDYEKFQKWAETVPYLPKNPLYHRTHMELQRYFGIYDPLSPATVEQIWNHANRMITSGSFSLAELLKKCNVEVVCTPQDPIASLQWHQKIQEDGLCATKVLPAFCPDKALSVANPSFLEWLAKLGEACSQEIETYASLQACLTERLLYFKSMGSKSAVQTVALSLKGATTLEEADAIFQKAKHKQPLTIEESAAYQAHLLSFLTKKYQDYGFSMEIQTVTAIATAGIIPFLEKIQPEHKLPKTVISTRNLTDVKILAKRIQQSKIAGAIRIGSCDELFYQKDAIKTMLQTVASYGVLPAFIGCSTGLKNVPSYPAQEYFRRVLADFLGDMVESGEYPNYVDLLKKFAKDIAYENAKQVFGLQ